MFKITGLFKHKFNITAKTVLIVPSEI
uniref:Uncharacterized protein n=1 Tax=Anguilla anguilla TaxID=7936 RepID=A0A0E9TZB6_ANGAN